MRDYFSYSSLQTFEKCPAQFSIRYIDGVEKTDESIEAYLGKRVHEVLESLYSNHHKDDPHPPSLDALLNEFHDGWNAHWHERIGIVNYASHPMDYFRLGESMLARYYRTYFPFDQSVLATELRIDFYLDDTRDYPMVGILDRVDVVDDNVVEIHDYKTGKRTLSQKAADKDEQLALYQLAWEQHQPNSKSIHLVWHFLRTGTEVHSQRTSDDILALRDRLRSTIDHIRAKIQDEEPFIPWESRLCYWCYYWEECPAKHQPNPILNP